MNNFNINSCALKVLNSKNKISMISTLHILQDVKMEYFVTMKIALYILSIAMEVGFDMIDLKIFNFIKIILTEKGNSISIKNITKISTEVQFFKAFQFCRI